ncbi:hypothetical protein VP01_11578g1, partial [Puccinia sorghi]
AATAETRSYRLAYISSTAVMFFPHLMADLDKKLLFKQGPKYYFPNQEPIPTDASESIQDLVRKYAEKTKVQENKNKANDMVWQPMEAPSMQMPTTSMILNRWEMWSLPAMHYGEDNQDNHIGFGLRQSQRLGNKEKEKSRQSAPEDMGNSTGPPNQASNKQPQVAKKRRPSYPGAWVKGDSDDSSSNTSGNLEPAKNPQKEPEKNVKEKL